jgi:hypothetical protein
VIESAPLIGACPHCRNPVQVTQRWQPGGINSYGGYVLECGKCRKAFSFRVGNDIHMSRVVSGAQVLEAYDEAVAGSREQALRRYGIAR